MSLIVIPIYFHAVAGLDTDRHIIIYNTQNTLYLDIEAVILLVSDSPDINAHFFVILNQLNIVSYYQYEKKCSILVHSDTYYSFYSIKLAKNI